MGYALNLCKFHIYNVPYNHNIAEEGMEMTQNRVRIVDVADALGLSTATISNVIHGKTEKISDETVKTRPGRNLKGRDISEYGWHFACEK